MRPKNIVIALLLALVIIILFFNKEESTFWLFGDIRTSKLIILAIFFLLGVITGAFLFRRKVKHPKEYAATNPNIAAHNEQDLNNTSTKLSDEDRAFIQEN